MRLFRSSAPITRWLVRAAVFAVALALLYIAALNVLLLTPLLEKLADSQGPVFHLRYQRAYAYGPGWVHAEGVKLSGGDSHVQWAVDIDRANFHLALRSLWTRQFHTHWVHADGLAVRIRMLESREEPQHDADVAPIPGFDGPPLAPIGPVGYTPPDKLFGVDLEGIDVRHVREVWVEGLHVTGDIHAMGRWNFHPAKSLEVGPARTEVFAMDVARGRRAPVARGLHGRLDATIDYFDVHSSGMEDMLRRTSAGADLEGVVDLGAAFDALAEHAGVTAVGELSLRLRPTFDHGVVRAGSTIELSGAPRLSVPASKLLLRSDVAARFVMGTFEILQPAARLVEGDVDLRDTEANVGEAVAKVGDLHIGAESLLVDLREPMSVELKTGSIKVSRARVLRKGETLVDTPFVDVEASAIEREAGVLRGSVHFDVPTVVAPSLVALGEAAHLSSGLSVTSGHGVAAANGELDLRERTLAAKVHLDANQIGVRTAKHVFVSDIVVDLAAHPSASGRATELAGSSVALTHLATSGVDGWWAKATATSALLRMKGDDYRFDVDAHLEGRDAAPLVPLVSGVSGVPEWLVKVLTMPGMRGDAKLHASPRELVVDGLRVGGGDSHVQATVEERPTEHREVFLVDKGPLAVGLELQRRAGPRVVLVNATDWFYGTTRFDDGAPRDRRSPMAAK